VFGADDTVARCFDLEKQEFRHFSKSKMSNTVEIFPAQTIDVRNFGESDLERFTSRYEKPYCAPNHLTYHDGEHGKFYLLLKEEKQLRVAKLLDTNLVEISTDEGSVVFDFVAGTVEGTKGALRTSRPCPIHVYTANGAQSLDKFLTTYLGDYET